MNNALHEEDPGEAFASYRVLLFFPAYRMAGSAIDAEDCRSPVRSQASERTEIISLKAYLTTIITHLAFDDLKSARVTREQYVGVWLPAPLLTSPHRSQLPLTALEQQEAISLAFFRLLETLSPPECALFLSR